MTEHLEIVFDTSAAIFRESTPGRALTAALRRYSLFMSPASAGELTDVILRPKFDHYISSDSRNQFIAALLRNASFLEPEESIRACPDPKDDKFLEIAVAGRVLYLVTGDEDLLVLNPFRGIRIVTAAEFVANNPADRP